MQPSFSCAPCAFCPLPFAPFAFPLPLSPFPSPLSHLSFPLPFSPFFCPLPLFFFCPHLDPGGAGGVSSSTSVANCFDPLGSRLARPLPSPPCPLPQTFVAFDSFLPLDSFFGSKKEYSSFLVCW